MGGRTPRARKPKKKEMRRAEKESLEREKTLNSERVRKQCVGKSRRNFDTFSWLYGQRVKGEKKCRASR